MHPKLQPMYDAGMALVHEFAFSDDPAVRRAHDLVVAALDALDDANECLQTNAETFRTLYADALRTVLEHHQVKSGETMAQALSLLNTATPSILRQLIYGEGLFAVLDDRTRA